MVDNYEKKSKNWLSETLFIATVTALSYIYSFQYEKGYISIFGIPSDLIDLSITKIFYVLTILVSICIFFWIFIDLALGLIKIDGNTIGPFAFRLLKLIPLIILFLIYFLLFGIWHWREWIWILSFSVLYAILEFVFPLFNKWGNVSYSEKLKLQDKVEQKFDEKSISLFKLFFNKAKDKALFLFVISTLGFIISYSAGQAFALRETNFLVVNNPIEIVVLRIYGDKMICAPFNRANKTIQKKFHILKISGDNQLILNLEEVGPLHIEDDMSKTTLKN